MIIWVLPVNTVLAFTLVSKLSTTCKGVHSVTLCRRYEKKSLLRHRIYRMEHIRNHAKQFNVLVLNISILRF
jgi:hypothetical protein